MKRLFALLAAAVCLTTTACQNTEQGKGMVVTMKENAVLLDVRTPDEYEAGHIAGAKLVPHDQIREKIGTVIPDKKTPVYVYCRSGRRVKIAIGTMKELGYTDLHDLGGMEDAKKALGK